MDIITGFEPVVVGSSPAEGTKLKNKFIKNYMKKIYLILFISLVLLFPLISLGAGLVPCGNPGEAACTLNDFFKLLAGLYNFMVWNIASPLAVLMVTVGGVLMLISAGNPNLFGLGKKTVYAAIIGIILVFGALLIINSILGLLGIAPIG